MSEKIYVNGLFIKSKETSFGEVLKLSIKVSDFGAFVKEHKNDAGYINIDVLKRKEASENGNTHYAVLDNWKSENAEGGAKKSAAKPQASKKAAPAAKNADFEDDIPF